ncbi:MAG TPA: hypothetical protein VNJ01_03430 [Bacteriovoracaceae bacterium]|nr:hypothetical protein [Bacteriovoracaceae bacterium]
MKKIVIMSAFFIVTLTLASLSHAGVSMKLEGSCKLVQADSSVKHFVYYSNFSGCSNKSSAAISIDEGQALYTGVRSFVGEKDVYSFVVDENGKKQEAVKLTFANSTGNTSGTITYLDDSIDDRAPRKRTAKVTCEIRDYEYAECR